MSSEAVILSANLALLEQAFELVGRIPDRAFGGSGEEKPVGPHFRHILEHYSSFVDGLAAGRIDYDARARETAIETDREAARERIRELIGGLTPIDPGELDRPAEARLECGLGSDEEQWSRTTVRRELHFLLSHTIHHYALIGLLLARHGVDPGEEFGVAPSTLKYWRSRPSCAPQAG
jgi:hypothetical protein